MRLYLRVINPIMALLTLLLCFWAATLTESEFNIFGLVKGGMNTYFFAKGLFSSCSLFIIGRILLEMFYHSDDKIVQKYNSKEIIYTISFGIFTIGTLVSLFLLSDSDLFEKESKTITEQNPKELQISKIFRVAESDELKYSLQLNNEALNSWNIIRIECKLLINGNFSDKVVKEIKPFEIGEKKDVIINFYDFRNSNVPESSEIKFEIEAIKPLKE